MHRAVAKKKILAQEMNQKTFWQAKNPPPPPPHHFSNGPSFTMLFSVEFFMKFNAQSLLKRLLDKLIYLFTFGRGNWVLRLTVKWYICRPVVRAGVL